MRVLIYTSTFLPYIGGAELAAHHLAQGLAEEGHRVLVVVQHETSPNPAGSYEIKRLKVPWGADRLHLRHTARRISLLRLLWTWAPDIVHAQLSVPCGHDMNKISALTRVQWVLTCQGEDIQKCPEIPYGCRLDPEQELRIGEAVRGAHGLIAIGRNIRDEYVSLGAEEEKIHDIPNPIAYEALSKRSATARHELGLSTDAPVVLAVGRNHPKKGFRRLLDVAASLRDNGVILEFVVVGRGCKSLEEYAQHLGISPQVHLFEEATPAGLASVRDVPSGSQAIHTFFHAADIFAMPSFVEGFGLVTVEAMAAGLPVVAYEGPGTEDVLSDTRCGVMVPQGDIAQFSDCLARFAEDAHLRRKIGKSAQEFATRYDRRVVARQHVQLYQHLVR